MVDGCVAADVVSSTWVVGVAVLSIVDVVVTSVVEAVDDAGCKCVTNTCSTAVVVASVAIEVVPSVPVVLVNATVLVSVAVTDFVVETSENDLVPIVVGGGVCHYIAKLCIVNSPVRLC